LLLLKMLLWHSSFIVLIPPHFEKWLWLVVYLVLGKNYFVLEGSQTLSEQMKHVLVPMLVPLCWFPALWFVKIFSAWERIVINKLVKR
jgi:hypothetical protein